LNGLDFTNNTYVVGTFNPDASNPESTLTTESQITGTIDTIVILPE
jgi:hypothetical protein